MGSRAKKKPGDEYICPKCGTDVMVTGFTLVSEKLRSYMRFAGRGAVRIATAEPAAHGVLCMACNKPLPIDPIELVRIA